jgi:LmbE family N-acetylglucosaminyl deacetylase
VIAGKRRALFVFAHQDDEYGAAPWILDELHSGAGVACVYLTDGGSRVTAAVRDAESRNALDQLGVDGANVAFLANDRGRIADLALADRCDEGLKMLEDWIAATAFTPSRLYAPSYEGGHPDHDAAHLIAAVVSAGCGIVGDAWHFSLYNAYRLPNPLFSTLRQLPTQKPRRYATMTPRTGWSTALLCRHYRSQWKTWIGLFPGALLERAILRREFVAGFDLSRLARRPYEGELLYERRFATTFADFAERVRNVSTRLTQLA